MLYGTARGELLKASGHAPILTEELMPTADADPEDCAENAGEEQYGQDGESPGFTRTPCLVWLCSRHYAVPPGQATILRSTGGRALREGR